MYIICKCGVGGNSISKRDLFWASTEIVEGLDGLESKSDTELKLESKVTALEVRLRESENTCSAQKVQIADLLGVLGESNKSIKDLENRNNRIKVALAVLGILFTSSMIIVFHTHQSYDLFTSYYTTSKTSLNALLASPLFHRL